MEEKDNSVSFNIRLVIHFLFGLLDYRSLFFCLSLLCCCLWFGQFLYDVMSPKVKKEEVATVYEDQRMLFVGGIPQVSFWLFLFITNVNISFTLL